MACPRVYLSGLASSYVCSKAIFYVQRFCGISVKAIVLRIHFNFKKIQKFSELKKLFTLLVNFLFSCTRQNVTQLKVVFNSEFIIKCHFRGFEVICCHAGVTPMHNLGGSLIFRFFLPCCTYSPSFCLSHSRLFL